MIMSNIILTFEPLHADNEKTSHNHDQTLPQTDLEIATPKAFSGGSVA